MKTKAIFLDVDGTLISFKTHKIPQTTIDALNQVHNNGIKSGDRPWRTGRHPV